MWYAIIGGLAIFILLHLSKEKSAMREEERLGREQVENIDNLDPVSQQIVRDWANEMMQEVGTNNMMDKRVLKFIGIKVQQSRKFKGL
jgi:hypothetical protein